MKYTKLTSSLIGCILLVSASISHAEEMMMARTNQTFPEAMSNLQETLTKLNYTISRVQRIDIGLTKSGFSTDKYRVVFFGREKEINLISEKYPHLIPYIPWKIAIFAEEENTLLTTIDPTRFSDKNYPGADKYLSQWKKDIGKIFNILRISE